MGWCSREHYVWGIVFSRDYLGCSGQISLLWKGSNQFEVRKVEMSSSNEDQGEKCSKQRIKPMQRP